MPQRSVLTKVISAFALTAATGAAACAAGCILLLALPAMGFAALGSVAALLSGALTWTTVLAVAIVAGAWVWIVWRSMGGRTPPARSTLYMMGGATALTTILVVWRQIEPMLIRSLGMIG